MILYSCFQFLLLPVLIVPPLKVNYRQGVPFCTNIECNSQNKKKEKIELNIVLGKSPPGWIPIQLISE